MEQLALDIAMEPRPGFDHFLATGNEAALHHLQRGIESLAQRPAGATPVPTYLWGETGTGKTHLLTATADALTRKGLAVGWLQGAPGRRPASEDTMEFQPHWHAIVLDNVESFDAAQQQQAFNWFINATLPQDGRNRWVIAAGRLPPVDLPLREDLRSRLGSGLSFGMHTLNDSQRLTVLINQADERGLHLAPEVARYLLHHYSRDLSSLTALLALLDSQALQKQRALTIPLLKTVIQTCGRPPD